MCGTWARFSKVLEFGYLFTFSCLGYRVPISVISLKPVILCVPSARLALSCRAKWQLLYKGVMMFFEQFVHQ